MKKILDEHGVLSYIENEVDNKDANATKNDRKTMSLMVQELAGQLGLRKLLNLKMKETDDSGDHIKTFAPITGAAISRDDILCALLNNLPDLFLTIVTVLENLPEESSNADVAKGKLRDKMERRGLRPNSDKSGERQVVENQNYPGRFMNYRRPNGFASQSRQIGNRQNQNQHSNYMEAHNKDKVCFVSESKRDFEENREEHDLKFFMDSDCTDHLVKDDSYFSSYVPLKKSIKIAVAKNGGFINAK
ncbi:hypothetical protein ILUMI_08278 [Ignelater luminosus]|uniref:Uncharacterized protein n=1 Tax=Ignelater luminosus TaxID=2038154 RepID=A0A8K0GDJ8_IGNLU|nr:hypothetical protein ILUMI_08278 [Ignelater luminosus]